jgi:UDP-N-acetylglucosamine 2-epimerase
MYDAVLQFATVAREHSTILEDLDLEPKTYLLTTIHRPYNTDIPENLRNIFQAFAEIGEVIVFPAHPRTSKKIAALERAFPQEKVPGNLKMIEPVGYLDMLLLEENARLILTDSGGMQKEAYFFGVPCITLRPETEWIETVEAGWNVLAGSDAGSILAAYDQLRDSSLGDRPTFYGDGRASFKVVRYMVKEI